MPTTTKPAVKAAARKAAPKNTAPKKSVTKKATYIKVTVDERTANMSTKAKKCRAGQHTWEEVPTESSRRLELIQYGQAEISEICSVCQSARKKLINARTGRCVKSPQRKYSEDYLLGKGQGRLPKEEAMKAYLVDLVPELRAA